MPAPKPPKFRRRAVELARQGGQSAPVIAKDLGITESCVRRWMVVDVGRVEGMSSTERAEMVELRRRNYRPPLGTQRLRLRIVSIPAGSRAPPARPLLHLPDHAPGPRSCSTA